MIVSIVVPAYNAEQTLAECLGGCTNQSYPEVEVIVVDDGSTDGTRQIAESFENVRYIFQENHGPATARNHGARLAKGERVAFTDSDCVPDADWIERLLSGFDEGVVAVGGSYRIANRSKALARMVHEEIELRHARFDSEVDFLGSFNVMYRKDTFLELGGFDESFLAASAEDNDLAYRLQDAGGVLRFVREARVAHYHPWRLRAYLRTQRQHGYWRMKLYAKHPRRAHKGDRYAGIVDLSAPALSLAALMCIPMLLLSAYGPTETLWLARAGWALIATYTLLRIPLPSRMMARSGDFRMLGFVGVVILRDVARALGMLSGAWRFLLTQRSSG